MMKLKQKFKKFSLFSKHRYTVYVFDLHSLALENCCEHFSFCGIFLFCLNEAWGMLVISGMLHEDLYSFEENYSLRTHLLNQIERLIGSSWKWLLNIEGLTKSNRNYLKRYTEEMINIFQTMAPGGVADRAWFDSFDWQRHSSVCILRLT